MIEISNMLLGQINMALFISVLLDLRIYFDFQITRCARLEWTLISVSCVATGPEVVAARLFVVVQSASIVLFAKKIINSCN